MPFILCIFTLFIACGSSVSSDDTPPTGEWVNKLTEKQAKILELENSARFSGSWESGCDWLLFASLTASLNGSFQDRIESAEVEPGKWLRRPTDKGDCYPDESSSQISKDMFLGLYWYSYSHNRLDILERIAKYAKDHNDVMGEPFPSQASRVLITVQLPLLYTLINSLGGEDNPVRKLFPPEIIAEPGFTSHLQVLSILLRAKVEPIPESSYNILRKQYERQPENAFFCAALVGFGDDPEVCANLLLSEKLWPNDRLPTKGDHCEFWPYQRETGSDWEPCEPRDEQLSAGAFLFVSDLLLRRKLNAIANVR